MCLRSFASFGNFASNFHKSLKICRGKYTIYHFWGNNPTKMSKMSCFISMVHVYNINIIYQLINYNIIYYVYVSMHILDVLRENFKNKWNKRFHCFTSMAVKLTNAWTKISLKGSQTASNFLLWVLVALYYYNVIKQSIISSEQYFCFQENDAQCWYVLIVY